MHYAMQWDARWTAGKAGSDGVKSQFVATI
jgi:hypothetical protein